MNKSFTIKTIHDLEVLFVSFVCFDDIYVGSLFDINQSSIMSSMMVLLRIIAI